MQWAAEKMSSNPLTKINEILADYIRPIGVVSDAASACPFFSSALGILDIKDKIS